MDILKKGKISVSLGYIMKAWIKNEKSNIIMPKWKQTPTKAEQAAEEKNKAKSTGKSIKPSKLMSDASLKTRTQWKEEAAKSKTRK